jgi:hypothetical protein
MPDYYLVFRFLMRASKKCRNKQNKDEEEIFRIVHQLPKNDCAKIGKGEECLKKEFIED